MAKKTYNKEQLNEIVIGIRNKVDTKVYEDISLKAEQMKELRLGLQEGFDVSKYNYRHLSAEHMRQIRIGMTKGIDTELLQPKQGKKSVFSAEQAKEIRLGLENKQDVLVYANPEYSAGQMREIRLGQKEGINADIYANSSFSEEQMHKVRMELVILKIIEKIKESLQHLYEAIIGKVKSVVEQENNELPQDEQLSEKDLEALIEEKAYDIIVRMNADMEKNPSFDIDTMSINQKVEAFTVLLGMDDVVNQYIASEFGYDNENQSMDREMQGFQEQGVEAEELE